MQWENCFCVFKTLHERKPETVGSKSVQEDEGKETSTGKSNKTVEETGSLTKSDGTEFSIVWYKIPFNKEKVEVLPRWKICDVYRSILHILLYMLCPFLCMLLYCYLYICKYTQLKCWTN